MSRTYTVEVGEGVAVLSTSHSSDTIVANVLGDETGPDGLRQVWLDRRVHLEDDTARDGWSFGGAITTTLSRHDAPSSPPRSNKA